ncbi:hypothetical protein EVAR_31767_1 [Eumeta japonica]|uniref:Uncharacterized protein n=1 Tax=Eumeta variegata TaxID=151549 RepID=A0A4C1W5Q5_EUMVA|nr:hypothetical protein EVAR_31767_1 [Eumeta japonica]
MQTEPGTSGARPAAPGVLHRPYKNIGDGPPPRLRRSLRKEIRGAESRARRAVRILALQSLRLTGYHRRSIERGGISSYGQRTCQPPGCYRRPWALATLKSCQCVAGLLPRNRVSDGEISGLMERDGGLMVVGRELHKCKKVGTLEDGLYRSESGSAASTPSVARHGPTAVVPPTHSRR